MKTQGLYFLIFSAIVAATSCIKKSDVADVNTGSYFVRFKANGTQQNFTIPATTSQFYDSITVAGNKVHIYTVAAANMNAHSIQIGIYADKPLNASTNFKESELLYSYQPKMTMLYVNNPSGFGNLSIGSYDPLPPYSYPSVIRDCNISITELTASSIKGSFSGTVYLQKSNGEPDVNNKTSITNGEFFLPAKF